MAWTTDTLVAAVQNSQSLYWSKASITAVAGGWYTTLEAAGTPGAGNLDPANTSTGVVPTDATAGVPTITNFTGGNEGRPVQFSVAGATAGRVRIVDLLWWAGRVSLASAVTTSFSSQPSITGRLPNGGTAADYGELEAWCIMETVNGAANTTVTIAYADQDGNTSGRTATLDSNLNAAPVNRMYPFRLIAGDRGISRIDSVTVATTSTGFVTVALVRPICEMQIVAAGLGEPVQDYFKLGGKRVFSDSCLMAMFLATTTSTGAWVAELKVGQGAA